MLIASVGIEAQGFPFRAPGGGGSTVKVGSVSSTGYSQTSDTKSVTGMTYTSTNSDENAVQVTGGTFTMNNCTIKKSAGNTSDSDGSSFYGINSAVYCAGSASTINMIGGTITTTATGANGIIAYNSGVINVSGVTINNTANLSRGIHATGGGVITASNLTITTAGNNSSVIATDRGGGTVSVVGGSYKTTGGDCAVLYSTGAISISDATGSSSKGEVGVIEGNNSINITNCDMTSGSSTRGMMILQSGSGDSQGYNGKITVTGGSIVLTGTSTPLLEVPTNITGTLTLKDVKLTVPSGVLLLVDYNSRWSTYGGTGNLILSTDSTWTCNGAVNGDKYGHINVTVNSGVTWNGSLDSGNVAASTAATINGRWNLTADSYVDKLTINNGGVINKNGYKLEYGSLTNNGSVVDGITSIKSDTPAGIVYDLNGRIVKSASSLTGLSAGIYVKSGKKFLIR